MDNAEGDWEQRAKDWWANEALFNYTAFLVLFVYTMWETRNRVIFKNTSTQIDISTNMLVQKAQEHQFTLKKGKKRTVKAPEIDKNFPWDFFDGASQGDPPIGGAGAIIFLDETNKIFFNIVLERASNNKEELSALWATMKIPSDKHIQRFHIYEDSKTVIDWETQRNNIRDPHLKNILKAIRAL